MKLQVEVLACDIDKKFPAKTYTITASDGRSISKDLCPEHAEPFEEWLEEVEVREEAEDDLKLDAAALLGERRLVEGEAEPAPEPQIESAPAAPKRQATKRAPAKKTTSRRRPKIVSLEEIEAKKKS